MFNELGTAWERFVFEGEPRIGFGLLDRTTGKKVKVPTPSLAVIDRVLQADGFWKLVPMKYIDLWFLKATWQDLAAKGSKISMNLFYHTFSLNSMTIGGRTQWTPRIIEHPNDPEHSGLVSASTSALGGSKFYK